MQKNGAPFPGKQEIDDIIKAFFAIFNNTNEQQPDWGLLYAICLPETIIIKKDGLAEMIYNLQTFIEPRKKILSDGTLKEFQESETGEETKIAGNIAQRFSTYQKNGYLNGNYFQEYGSKFFQLINTNTGWKINALIWEDHKPGTIHIK